MPDEQTSKSPELMTATDIHDQYVAGTLDAGNGKVRCPICEKTFKQQGFWPHVGKKHQMTRPAELRKVRRHSEGHEPLFPSAPRRKKTARRAAAARTRRTSMQPDHVHAEASSLPQWHGEMPAVALPQQFTQDQSQKLVKSIQQFVLQIVQQNGPATEHNTSHEISFCYRCGFNLRAAVFDIAKINHCPGCGNDLRQVSEAMEFLKNLPE